MLVVVEKRFQAVEDLIRQVEAKGGDEPDLLALVVTLIKFAVRSEIDPYLLNGVLIEAITNTIHSHIPGSLRRQVATETIRMLLERLQAGGAFSIRLASRAETEQTIVDDEVARTMRYPEWHWVCAINPFPWEMQASPRRSAGADGACGL